MIFSNYFNLFEVLWYSIVGSTLNQENIIITFSYNCGLLKQLATRSFSTDGKMQYVNRAIDSIKAELLSFEEICPQWSLALRLGYTNNPNLDIQDAKNCIVGEAHGFRNRGLRCSKCWEYSQSFTFCTYGNKMHNYIITDTQRFEDTKFEFVSHFNQKHLLNRSDRRCIIVLPDRLVQRISQGLRNLFLSLFSYRSVPEGSNAVIINQTQ